MYKKLQEAVNLYNLKGVHPAADLMPLMTGEEFKSLVKDVKEKGFLHPVRVTNEGLVIDGRNRLCASIDAGKDVSIVKFDPSDPISYVLSENMQRRHLTISQRAMIATEAEALYAKDAKERQRAGGGWHGNQYEKVAVSANLQQPAEQYKASQKAAKALNVGTRSVNTAKKLKAESPELAEQVTKGEKTLNAAVKENKEMKAVKYTSKFNETNDNIEWARYTWNPVTGCKTGCEYCYARDIAMRFDGHFNPTFHEERLSAPANTKCKPGFPNNVFVCSMADLFGEWVPAKWIEDVLAVVRGNPQWNFLFLTKNPKRYREFDFSKNCWLGATADTQERADNALDVFNDSDDELSQCTYFLSCEPLRENICIDNEDFYCRGSAEYRELDRISIPIDWLIIGGQSKSTGAPAFQPEWSWVLNLLMMAERANIPVYFKPNLTVRPKEMPMA